MIAPEKEERVDHSGEDRPLHPALRFFPVHERSKTPKNYTRAQIFAAVLGFDYVSGMTSAAAAARAGPPEFPWAVPVPVLERILEPFLGEGRGHGQGHVSAVEVGAHTGTTSCRLARLLADHSPESYLVCVDTWSHDASEFIQRRGNLPALLGAGNSSTLFTDFLMNVIARGVQGSVLPLRLPAVDAARVLFFRGARFNVAFVDGGRSYYDTALDLALYWELLEPGGIAFGSNYQIEGVARAVDEFSRARRAPVRTETLRVRDGVAQTLWMMVR